MNIGIIKTIILLGVIALVITFIFIIFAILMAPKSIKNGEEFVIEYHRAAGNKSITKVKKAWIFYFPFYPINRSKQQILPYLTASWKRYWFILGSLFWAEIANQKEKGNVKTFLLMAFSRMLSQITLIAAFVFILMSINDSSNKLHLTSAIHLIVISIALASFPTYVILKKSPAIIEKTKYSSLDKKTLNKFIKLYFIVALISVMLELLDLVYRMFEHD